MEILVYLLLLLPVLAVLAYPFVFQGAAGSRWPALGAGVLTTLLGSPLLAFLFLIVPSFVLDKGVNTAERKEEIAYTTLAFTPLRLLAALWLERRILQK